ncbi:MAG: hypothetical protein K940chlam7_01528 [Chlamydiae bacterium]|nr:hypothetical protein [Chlamydiota bacterium]
MKDARHHLRYVQKKVMKSAKKEEITETPPISTRKILRFKRPKTILNKRKIA